MENDILLISFSSSSQIWQTCPSRIIIIIRFDSFESRWCAQPFEIPMMKAPGYHFELRSCVRPYYCPWQWQIVITPITRTRVTYHFRTRSTLVKNLDRKSSPIILTRDSFVCKIIHRCFFKFPCSIKWEYVVQAVLIQSVVIHIRNIYFEDYIYTFFILFLHLLLFMYLYTLYFKNLKLF